MDKIRILFVCSGNSVRSQIAEGFAGAFGGDRYLAESAGTMPIGVHPDAVACMNEAGIDISNNSSDFLGPDMLEDARYVVTLCSSARDRLPHLPPGTKHIHWDIENPDKIYPSEQARRYGFAAVRDEIETRVKNLLSSIENGEL